MRITEGNNFLSLEKFIEIGSMFIRVNAELSDSHSKFTGQNDIWMLSFSTADVERFNAFHDLKDARFALTGANGSWIQLQRDQRGYIAAKFRVTGWHTPTALEAVITVHGEFSQQFCHDFASLLST